MTVKLTIEIELNKLSDPEVNEATLTLLGLLIARDGEEKPELESVRSLVHDSSPGGRRRRKSNRRPVLTGTPEERWNQFYEDLPERSKFFADLLLLRSPEPVTQDEVMDALEMDTPKAMGGLLGTLTRWSTAVGVTCPWEPEQVEGKRAWRWTGFPSGDADESSD